MVQLPVHSAVRFSVESVVHYMENEDTKTGKEFIGNA